MSTTSAADARGGPARSESAPDESARERAARAAWSALVEPGDVVAGALVGSLGAADAWEWLRDAASRVSASDEAVPGTENLAGDSSRRTLHRTVERWRPRLERLGQDHGTGRDGLPLVRPTQGMRVIVPGDESWPPGLDDLGTAAPLCLWARGDALGALAGGSVALVGARAATTYGERVAYDLALGLAHDGIPVVSGGAYGIDAAAHRGALAAQGRTVVVLAGGADRAYPAGNARIFEQTIAGGGAIVSEVPPRSLPTRSRFLQRNRLIAAAASGTVVVEAAWRSGALSTANHAARLFRPVGAVPGPVTSMASAGCHRLLRDGLAVCVTDAAEVVELVGPVGAAALADEPVSARLRDGLEPDARLVLDALGRRLPRSTAEVAAGAGVAVAQAQSALGLLEVRGLAERVNGGWLARVSSRA